jgi:hypothetical protein
MEKSSQIAWKIVPLRHFFRLKVVPLIEVLLYVIGREGVECSIKFASSFRFRDKDSLGRGRVRVLGFSPKP